MADFKKLHVWQRGHALALSVDRACKRIRAKQYMSLRNQIFTAALSIPANIAEGFGKYGNKEFARYVRIAKGSEVEVLNHLIDLRDQRLISEDELLLAEHAARRALNAAVGLIRHLEHTPDPPRAPKREKKNPEPMEPD